MLDNCEICLFQNWFTRFRNKKSPVWGIFFKVQSAKFKVQLWILLINTFIYISNLRFGFVCFIICIEFTGMWIRGRQKPIHKQYKKMCTESAQKKLARNASFFVYETRCIARRWSHIPLSCVGVPSAMQQGALRPKAGGVIFMYDF